MFFMGNKYDGYTPGLVFSNLTFPRSNWEYWVAPLYGLKSKEVVGFAGLRRNIFHHSGPFSLTEIGLNYRRFNFLDLGSTNHPYNRISIKKRTWLKPQKPWISNRVETELTLLRLDNLYEKLKPFWETDVLRISWVRESGKKLLPFKTRMDVKTGGDKGALITYKGNGKGMFVMGNAEAEIFVPYPNKSKKKIGFRAKAFTTGMIHNFGKAYLDSGAANFVVPVSGPNFLNNDPTFSHLAVARTAYFNDRNSLWSQVLVDGTNGIRMFPAMYTDKWVVGINTSTHIIPFLPVQLFFDAAIAPSLDEFGVKEKLLYAGGLCYSVEIGKATGFELNVPLFYSQTFANIKELNPSVKWYQYASFRIKLDLNDPFDIIRNFIY